MIVSLNTLRTHTKNIFNKLGVNTAGRPSAAPRNWIYSSWPEITNPGPGKWFKPPAGAFLFSAINHHINHIIW